MDNLQLHDMYFPKLNGIYPQIYAFSIPEHSGLKVGYTERKDLNDRLEEHRAEQKRQGLSGNLTLVYPPKDLDAKYRYAIRNTDTVFTDHDVHRWLRDHGIEQVQNEWFKCTEKDVEAAVKSLITGTEFSTTRVNTYRPRREQQEAIDQTEAYFKRMKVEDPHSAPKYLWNCKMRFGKTYTALEFAVKMQLKRVLVVTFKVETKDSWKTELLSHVDFKDWQWVDVKDKTSFASLDESKPFLAFGSFQDLLGRNELGGIKAKNEWIHTTNWDLIIFDEYHYGSWRDRARDMFDDGSEDMELLDDNILPITTEYMLFLSGTPFRAINTGEFIEDQIYNWTYSDEQQAKVDWDDADGPNPYAAMPEMILMTYQLPEACTQIALKGEQDEFDLNEFFHAEYKNVDGAEKDDPDTAHFVHEDEVQRWLDIIRGKADISSEAQKAMGADKPVLPYADVDLLSIINHTIWYMHSVASCYAMKNLLAKPHNAFYHDYTVVVAAGNKAGSGASALIPVRKAMGNPLQTKTITITCGKLTTGVTVKPWSAIFMLTSITTPEAYFQSAFRVQSGWTVKSGDAQKPDVIMKPKCYIFDFAPNRALSQLSEYACSLNTDSSTTAEEKVAEFTKFLPVLAFDGTGMYPISATEILDYVVSGTTATLLAKKWDSALMVNVDNLTLTKIINNKEAMDAIMNIEGFRAMGSDVFETIVNRTNNLKKGRGKETGNAKADAQKKRELSEQEKEIKSKRKQIQENLRKFATRIPLFMYLTDYREQTVDDLIRKIEPGLFKRVTGLTVQEFEILKSLNVFNSSVMNDAVAAFRRYEESSLTYTGMNRHYGEKIGLWDISVKHDELIGMTN